MNFLFLVFLVCGVAQTQAKETGIVQGVVVDAQGGEPLLRVSVELLGAGLSTQTDSDGRFLLRGVPAGKDVLQVTTVGYRLLKEPFEIKPGETRDFDIVLSPTTFRQKESIEVRAGPFESIQVNSPSEVTIEGSEIKNLSSVLAEDPLRAVQGMPGVSSNDDFNSFFTVRGADFRRVGIYMDGILLHMPFHMVDEQTTTGSISAFNGDIIESISLYTGAYPVSYGDRSAAAVDVRSREGSRKGVFVRGTVSMSSASATAEGPIGGRGSWLTSFRKSYLQYLLRRVSDEDTFAFGYIDGQARVTYDLTSKHTVTLGLLDGFSDLDQTRDRNDLGFNTTMVGDYHVTLSTVNWRYTPNSRWLITNRGAYMREKSHNVNRADQDLLQSYYGEWVWNADAAWHWSDRATLELGGSVRRLRDDGFWNRYEWHSGEMRRLEDHRGRALRTGGYAQQSWNVINGRLRLSSGVRWDWHELNKIHAVSPHASLSLYVAPRTQFRFAWGQYVQYPELEWMAASVGGHGLMPERSNHILASIEHVLNERTRIRAEVWNRDDRDLLVRPYGEPRMINGLVFVPPYDAPIRNSVRGYSRGFQIFLQRRSANRLSGWISYAYGRTGMREGDTGNHYVADRDQLHTVNVFGTYRIRPTVNLSAKWVYGSNFPIYGYFREGSGGRYYLAENRNALRVDPYHRLDLRINKAIVRQGWKMTLYAEVLNVYDHDNERFYDLKRYRYSDGRAWLTFYKLFPILPSVGIVFEFGK